MKGAHDNCYHLHMQLYYLTLEQITAKKIKPQKDERINC